MSSYTALTLAIVFPFLCGCVSADTSEQEVLREVFWRNRSAKEAKPTEQSVQYRQLLDRIKGHTDALRKKRSQIPIEPLATKLITDSTKGEGLSGVFVSNAQSNPNLLKNPYFKLARGQLSPWLTASNDSKVSVGPDLDGIFTNEGIELSLKEGATISLMQTVNINPGTFELSCVWSSAGNADIAVIAKPNDPRDDYTIAASNTKSFSRTHAWKASATDVIATKTGKWEFVITIKGGLKPEKVRIAYASFEMLTP